MISSAQYNNVHRSDSRWLMALLRDEPVPSSAHTRIPSAARRREPSSRTSPKQLRPDLFREWRTLPYSLYYFCLSVNRSTLHIQFPKTSRGIFLEFPSPVD